ncbi:MAG: non-canonical purine NTP pyrophosphatase [Treponemataceae bacterium]|nr:non-canonical purine NTP pyrophosphatase [Treponemataceae bacterium]
MKLLYATTNKAKLESMQRVTNSLNIEIIGLKDLQNLQEFKNIELPQIDESGKNPLENAIIKAKAYYKVLQIPLFSCDSGLYFENVDEKNQPGTHIRRVNGKTLTDEEALEYYAKLATSYGGKIKAKYKNAICLILDEKNIFSSMDSSLEIEPFYLVDKPHSKVVEGFPLDSLSVDIKTEKYYNDLEDNLAVDKSTIEIGFTNFFKQVFSQITK